ncbi:uncharacterized protein BT62DRAFT_937230 [Guyanagaster necrorhizus]|uniref:Uncharacterized protein n=1 Tax=Guyanagaster necrorhizus TaxID=856835 RepID=A0A9P7VIT0_9AGAR|nr:uncharacterized protein BT62DRAFT_937230 [Guyanagaster necrorhizus MCA 3950]KAG7441310.1 hypothetical protein BT62DRAFT_937230 [Guyanagaster necrorhizus MCA 3950]
MQGHTGSRLTTIETCSSCESHIFYLGQDSGDFPVIVLLSFVMWSICEEPCFDFSILCQLLRFTVDWNLSNELSCLAGPGDCYYIDFILNAFPSEGGVKLKAVVSGTVGQRVTEMNNSNDIYISPCKEVTSHEFLVHLEEYFL